MKMKMSDLSYTERAVLVASQPFTKGVYELIKREDGNIMLPNSATPYYFTHLFRKLKPGEYKIHV